MGRRRKKTRTGGSQKHSEQRNDEWVRAGTIEKINRRGVDWVLNFEEYPGAYVFQADDCDYKWLTLEVGDVIKYACKSNRIYDLEYITWTYEDEPEIEDWMYENKEED